jgi:PAS domain S-box-containing protein
LHQEDGVHHSIVSKFPIRAVDGHPIMIGGVAIDITERRKAEDDLRRSERELTEFFENASVAVHSVARDGTILRANRAELDMLGYRREEYVGRNIVDFHVDRDVIDDILTRLTRGETLREYPAHLRCKDGSVRDVLINSNVLFEDGNFIHTRCFTHDITDLKRAQQAQAALAAIVESSDDAIVSKSLDGIIQSWNPAAERIFGYTAQEAVGRSISIIIPPDKAAEGEEILRCVRSGQRVNDFESVRVRKDGRIVPVSLTVSPIKEELGHVVGASEIARDISARKQSEGALRESEERFRTLADSSPALIWVNGLEGCEFVNRAYLDFLGVKPGDVRNFEWAQFVHPADRDQVVNAYQAAFSKHEAYVVQHRFRRRDGVYRWMKSVGMPRWGAAGALRGYVGSTLDITDIKEAEDALREADRRKDEFLATLGHELRNPLAAISTGATLLQSHPAPERRAWIEEMITRQAKQLQRLVDDLLDVSRITRGKIELRKERTSLQKLLEGSVAAVHDLMQQQRIQLSLSAPSQQICVDADPARIEQIIVNLLTNAAKYTPEGGNVWLSAELLDQEVIIRCRDTGVGLSAEILDAIFEPFAQFNLSAERMGGGLGLGLTLVKALAEMHGGSVKASSAGSGKGSEFAIHLPAAGTAEPPAWGSTPSISTAANQRLRILLVDDNQDLANGLALFFRDAGHQVSVAHDGETAIPIALRERPEIVFLDIGLPGMDGFSVADQLRASADLKHTMIIAISGWKLHEKEEAAGTRFDAKLVKPVGLEQLTQLLQMRMAR